MTTDIIVTTRNRVGYLKRTLSHIYGRTNSEYNLSVIDDASDDGETVDFLIGEHKAGRIHHLHLRGQHAGPMANHNLAAWASFSDPVVLVDDDVLCPDLRPDWLARGLKMMERRPDLGMLALRHPGAKVKVYRKDNEVGYCRSLGATFLFCRRELLEAHPLPHERGSMAWPMEPRCKAANESGWLIGVMIEVFCYHIGEVSALNGAAYPGRDILVIDEKTLEPEKRYW